jgi:EmrB/QacA subfamily drug resistance transporter
MARRGGGTWALAALVVADVAFAFQQTAVVPAIPSVQRDLDASQAWSAWLLTGYLVASSVATPLLGKLGDRHGRRRALLGSLAGFLLGSIGASLAPNIAVLIGCRALQGLGGAVFPLTLSLARDELPRERLPLGIGLLTGAFGIGTSLGFGVSGAIVDALSWRWLFGIGAIVVAAAIAAVLAAPATDEQTRPGRIDLPGTLLFAGGLALLLIALTEGIPRGYGSPWVIAGFLVSAALLAAWVVVDLRVDDPLLDLRVLVRPAVLLTNVTTLALGYVLFGTYFLLPYLVQGHGPGYGLGAGPVAAGLYLLPSSLGQAVSGPAAGKLAERLEAKWICGAGMATVAAASALLAAFHDRPWQIAAWSLLLGLGAGPAISVVSDLVTELVEQTETGAATSLNSTLRRVGGGIGGQVGALLLATIAVSPHVPANRAFVAAFAIGACAAAAPSIRLPCARDR